jgi:hypothetical protein
MKASATAARRGGRAASGGATRTARPRRRERAAAVAKEAAAVAASMLLLFSAAIGAADSAWYFARPLAGLALRGGAERRAEAASEATAAASETAVRDGPSVADIKAAAEKAVQDRFAATAGYRQRAAVSRLRVIDRRPLDGTPFWSVLMALDVEFVSADDAAPRRGRHGGLPEAPPRWVSLGWSGQRWFIMNLEVELR